MRLGIAVILNSRTGIRVLCIYDELLEGVKHLHPLFVHLGLNNVFEENKLVEGDAEIVSRDHHSPLALNHNCCFHVLCIAEIQLVVTFSFF